MFTIPLSPLVRFPGAIIPTAEPTEEPTAESTEEPTAEPTEEPTAEPTEEPTAEPTEEPTAEPTEEPTAEPTAEPTEEPTPAPVARPAQTFTARAAGISVTVVAEEGAFPEGTTMRVRRVWDNGTLTDIRESVAEDFLAVRRVQAVDITFHDAQGNEIEPLIPVAVTLSVSEIDAAQEALVVHLDDEGQTEVVARQEAATGDGQTSVNLSLPGAEGMTPEAPKAPQSDLAEITFDAEGFSVYAIVVTEVIETRYIDASGNTYWVRVGYGQEAEIPAGSVLAVSEITGEEANAYAAQAAQALDVAQNQVAYVKALDIAIVSDGAEIRPAAPVQVTVDLLDASGIDEDTDINVLHFGEEVESVDCALAGETVIFETDGFSVYVVVQIKQNRTLGASGEDENEAAGSTVTAPTAVENLVYNGQEQALVTARTVDGGTFLYALGENDESVPEDVEGDTTVWSESVPYATNAGTYYVWSKPGTEDTAQCVTVTIAQKPLTITAGNETKMYTGSSQSLDSNDYTDTELAEGDTIVSVTLTGEQTYLGSCEIVPSAATIKNASNEDVTNNYAITYVNGTLTVTWPDNMVEKKLTDFNGNLATYEIIVNPENYVLTADGQTYILKDTFSENQSINYGSVNVSNDTVTYDFSGQTGTYTVPDGAKVTITYTTRVKGQVDEPVSFYNTAVVGSMEGTEFKSGPSAKVTESKTISPTGTDISGTGGVYSIDLFAYADGHMERGLGGAEFRLLDQNMRPMYYLAGENSGKEITFATGEDGTVAIVLNSERDGLSIQKNTVYFLEMVNAPYDVLDGVYYQKDDTFYSFLITDEPSYKYGNIYSYFNGDVLKVRCYPEAEGINVTKRFGGNYTLTDAQKNAITFTLQKEAQYTVSGWVDVESHTYADFAYGSINFDTGRKGGTELEDFATYRIIEEHALPEALADTIDENVSVTVSYQQDGKRVTENSNEFTVDPDEKLAFSYDFAFTNEYVDHKLTIIKIDENSGKTLPGTEFEVYAANNAQMPVTTLTTGEDGAITIRKTDEYDVDILYYVVESKAPKGYVIPASPEKVYFYFSEDGGAAPSGLPAGATATDLTTSYNTVTLPNSSAKVSIPVTVVWGINSNEAWPDNVRRVVVGLYKSVGGAAAEKVLDNNSEALTLELTKEKYYDTTTFVNLPAQEDGKNIDYSVEEEGIYDPDETNITNQFADSVSVSGTDWYVVKNEPAVSVTVQKLWFEQDGTTQVTDTSDKSDVSFDLYRTTRQAEGNSFNRAELVAFLADAEKVRKGLTLSKDSWSTTIDSLQSTDRQGRPYYYYALENPIPDNQEDSYLVVSATDSVPRTLTIKNKQTPITVTIKAGDLTKTYGDEEPAYELTASVMQDDASAVITGPDVSGKYTATVTDSQGAKKAIAFTVSRDEGENVGTYTITPSGEASQAGYRVLFETGKLTINPAEVTITAGASKVYGEDDPALVTVTGLKNNDTAGSGDSDTVKYTVFREEGEDVGDYPITLTGESDQGNYRVIFENANATFTITRASATVTAVAASKVYGEDDPELTATVTGLQRGDEASVLNYELTREAGEDVGTYDITPAGEAEQGNYAVTYASAKFTITPAALTVKVVDTEKTYGDEDPEWEAEIDGLFRDDEGGTLTSELNEQTGARAYTYTLGEGDGARTLLTFAVTREAGEGVGSYAVTPGGDDSHTLTPDGKEAQGNYTLTYESGTLSIERAELFVTADHVVKAVGVETDPLLTATVSGWKNGDDPLEDTTLVSTQPDENGTVTRTYRRGTDAAEVVFYVISSIGADGTVTWTYRRGDAELLTFTLKRDPGEEEGEYPITVLGEQNQSNYSVEYEQGTFGILSILDVDVKQPVIDYADDDAAPSYTYVAKLDLTGTGLVEYKKNGFDHVDGVPTLTFTLPDANRADTMTLKVPGGAKLTVEQISANDDYTTALTVDGNPHAIPENPALCRLDHVDTYHEIAFTHSRISYPVEAWVSESQSEADAKKLEGRKGAMGIPTGEDLTRAIDADFADEMNSRIGYVLPTDKYYMYDHASLYTTAGTAVEGASNVSAIRYDRESGKWQYRVGEGEFTDAAENTRLALFYLPRFVCKVGEKKFYSLSAAVDYVRQNTAGKTATVEMLIGDYSIRASGDAVTIPEGYNITITTAETEYEGAPSSKAVISRSMSYPAGHLFYNDGTLTFDNIILDGKSVQATDALVLNRGAEPTPSADPEEPPVPAADPVLNINAGATLRNAGGNNGGAIYVKKGVVTVDGALTGNAATSGGAVYMTGGALNVNGNISNNNATSGGGVYMTGGALNVSGTISNNSATNGGGVYMTGGALNVSGTISNNSATNGGGAYLTGGTLNVSGAMNGNTATAGGGAVYSAGGAIDVTGGSMSENHAANGGAVYLASGSFKLTDGSIAGNRATANGGAIYGAGGTLNVSGGSMTANAANGNGGAIYTANTAVSVTGGTIGGAAGSGNRAANGGAIGVGTASARLYFKGNADVTGNTMDGGNASNVFLNVNSDQVISADADSLKIEKRIGIRVPAGANYSGRGDVGGFFGAYTTAQNVNDTNVKFPVLESVFGNDAYPALDAKYENNRLYWGAALTYDVVFKAAFDAGESPEPPEAGASYNNTSGNGYRQIALDQTCYPHGETDNVYPIYSLVSSLDLYNKNKKNFDDRGAKAASVYAYTYANSQQNQFDAGLQFSNFITAVRWDTEERKWQFVKANGEYADVSGSDRRIVIVYSAPAYIAITNNNGQNLSLSLTLTVNGRNTGKTHYGYATARNGATVKTEDFAPLNTKGNELVLKDGESIKLLIPGAAGKAYALTGTFDGAGDDTQIKYTINNGDAQTNTGAEVNITGRSLPSGYSTEEIVFGTALPICKIGEETFPTLTAAVEYMKAQEGTTFTVEMLVDYLIPSTDVLNIPSGYQVTFTTSQGEDFRGANKGKDGKPNRAILSRDFGNMGASVTLNGADKDSGSTLTVTNLMFDGRAIAGTGNGGAISTKYCDVTIDNCDFSGYQATRGGAIFVERGGANDQNTTSEKPIRDDDGEPLGGLKIFNSTFENCISTANIDKAGGGAVWTSAKGFVMKSCILKNCACIGSSAQGGAVFHNIVDGKNLGNLGNYESGYSGGTMSVFEDLTFYDCYSIAGAGGAIETDAQDTVVTRCKFYSCYTNAKGGGGAIIIYARDKATPDASLPCTAVLSDCEFNNSRAEGVSQGGWGGGAIRATTRDTTLINCTFDGATTSKNGGALCVTNTNATSLTIIGGSFNNCTAMDGGGAVYFPGPDLYINEDAQDHEYEGKTTFTYCTAQNYGGGLNHAKGGGIAKTRNVQFVSCTSRTGKGGGLYTEAQTLTATGSKTKFENCTAQLDGGGTCHWRDAGGSSASFSGTYVNCVSNTATGGAIRSAAKTVNMEHLSVSDCQAVTAGGGAWINPSTGTITDCTFSGNRATGSDGSGGGVYVFSGNGTVYLRDSAISDCSAVQNGGGWYQHKAKLYILNSSISGSATSGGGLYVVGDGNNRVYHYSGTVEGTATGNGGAVYFGAGEYHMRNDTVDDVAYSGAAIGSVTTNAQGLVSYTATAGGDGGGIYQNGGTVYVRGGSISGRAGGNGGGLYSKNTVEQSGGHITGSATNGGGVYKTASNHYSFSGGTITGTATGNGGAVYHDNNQFNLSGTAVIGEKDVNGQQKIASAARNGGGVYVAGGTFNMNGGSGYVGGATASQNGGGAYVAGGTYNFNGGSIADNTADGNGGGVYYAGGTFNMSGNGASKFITGNTADKGAGVFVANGMSMKIDTWDSYINEIRNNHAVTEGGGIAVGGANAVLNFKNKVIVRDNTMGSANTACNVYLDQDSNTVIKNDWLNSVSYIGVYVKDSQQEAHGLPGMPFGTYSNEANLDVYHNDRARYLTGTKGSNKLVKWSEFVCKITDGEGNLLYKDASGNPAVYGTLENIGGTGAFNVVNVSGTPALYTQDGTQYNGGEYQVQMLVPSYDLGNGMQMKMSANTALNVTLTTASTIPDECGFAYIGDPRFSATIKRTANTWAMLCGGDNYKGMITVRNIILDGGNNSTAEEGAILRLMNNSGAILDEGAIFQNGGTNNKAGGAVCIYRLHHHYHDRHHHRL